jgi:hypothetical protein
VSEIAVLVPVLGRPERARKLVHNIFEASSEYRRVLFLCSPRDREQVAACKRTQADWVRVEWDAGPGDFAKKINRGLELTEEPFVFCAADDLTFQPGWDVHALRVAEETGAGVIGTWDGANPKTMKGEHSTHSLVRRSYAEDTGGTVDGTGAIYCELYDHQCVDNELIEVAQARGQWAFAQRSHVLHHHPIFDRSVVMDETYRKALAKGKEDIALFLHRRRMWSRGQLSA